MSKGRDGGLPQDELLPSASAGDGAPQWSARRTQRRSRSRSRSYEGVACSYLGPGFLGTPFIRRGWALASAAAARMPSSTGCAESYAARIPSPPSRARSPLASVSRTPSPVPPLPTGWRASCHIASFTHPYVVFAKPPPRALALTDGRGPLAQTRPCSALQLILREPVGEAECYLTSKA